MILSKTATDEPTSLSLRFDTATSSLHQLFRRLPTITLRVVFDPPPQICTGLLHGMLCLPLELLVGMRRIRRKVKHVALAAFDNLVSQLAANNRAKSIDDLKDGAATARAEVPGFDSGLVVAEVVESNQMTLGEILDVNVIADSGAIARRVIWVVVLDGQHRTRRAPKVLTISKNKNLLAITSGNLAEERQQVVWYALRVFSHDAARMGTAWVEVTQIGAIPLLVRLSSFLQVITLSIDKVDNDVFNHRLGAAVRVGRALGAVLGDGNHVREAGGITVHGRRGRKDYVGHVVALHGTEKRKCAADIDAVVLERDFAGLANGLARCQYSRPRLFEGRQSHLEGSKVDDAVNGWVLGKHLVNGSFICDVGLVKGRTSTAE